ncbi:MAG: putative glycoside hydrolase [Steroidobacteraceae bacterium]
MLHHPIRRLFAALAAVAALALCASAFAFSPPQFPRLAGIENGGQANYNDPTYQAALAKLSVMILKYWPGLTPGGESMQSIIEAIKAQNPNALVFLYADADAADPSATSSMSPLIDKINAMHWWLEDGTSVVPSFYGHGEVTINSSPDTPKDASGETSIDWIARWYVSNYYTPNPDIDGLFLDNVFPQPRVAGDWNDEGVVLQASDPKAAAALQAGYERWFSLTHELMPGKYQIGNIGSWVTSAKSVPAGYVDMVNGGVLEALIGEPYSAETWGGWQGMMNEYQTLMRSVSEPKLVIFNQWGDPTDYQSFRYGFASCLMDDGYYSFTSSSTGYYGVEWFDEYNAKLGNPIGAPPTGAWQKGVWRRDFSNGIALVNPKGNGAQTVTLGGSFVKLKGTQDPAVNNGQTVTEVTLGDRDGIILLRQSPLTQPKAPTSVSAGLG